MGNPDDGAPYPDSDTLQMTAQPDLESGEVGLPLLEHADQMRVRSVRVHLQLSVVQLWIRMVR